MKTQVKSFLAVAGIATTLAFSSLAAYAMGGGQRMAGTPQFRSTRSQGVGSMHQNTNMNQANQMNKNASIDHNNVTNHKGAIDHDSETNHTIAADHTPGVNHDGTGTHAPGTNHNGNTNPDTTAPQAVN